MEFYDGEHRVGQVVWCYAFNRLGGKKGRFHNIKPVRGLILGRLGLNGIEEERGSIQLDSIALYKVKNGKVTDDLSNKSISLFDVKLAESYEEAVEKYNELVKNEAEFYKQKLDQVNSYLIGEDK